MSLGPHGAKPAPDRISKTRPRSRSPSFGRYPTRTSACISPAHERNTGNNFEAGESDLNNVITVAKTQSSQSKFVLLGYH